MTVRDKFLGFSDPFDCSSGSTATIQELSKIYDLFRRLNELVLISKIKPQKVDFPLEIFVRSGGAAAQQISNLNRFKYNRRDIGVRPCDERGEFVSSICIINPVNSEESIGEYLFEQDFREPDRLRKKCDRLSKAFVNYFELAPYQQEIITEIFTALIPG